LVAGQGIESSCSVTGRDAAAVGACISIVAIFVEAAGAFDIAGRQFRVDATFCWVTQIDRAWFLIVTFNRRIERIEDASFVGFAQIQSAQVVVLTRDQRVSALTGHFVASILGALISVRTVLGIENAALVREACVECACVIVIALDEGMGTPKQVVAGVQGAQIAIVTVVGVLTSYVCEAIVNGTRIAIITSLLFVHDIDTSVFIVA
jgi:hypothetical protein